MIDFTDEDAVRIDAILRANLPDGLVTEYIDACTKALTTLARVPLRTRRIATRLMQAQRDAPKATPELLVEIVLAALEAESEGSGDSTAPQPWPAGISVALEEALCADVCRQMQAMENICRRVVSTRDTPLTGPEKVDIRLQRRRSVVLRTRLEEKLSPFNQFSQGEQGEEV